MQDYDELSVLPWRVVVVDEAHRLRTAGNKLTDCLGQILAKVRAAPTLGGGGGHTGLWMFSGDELKSGDNFLARGYFFFFFSWCSCIC